MKKEKKKFTSIYISKKLAEELKIISIKQGKNRNTVIRNIIAELVKEYNDKINNNLKRNSQV